MKNFSILDIWKSLVMCAIVMLSGCEKARNAFGIDHYQPDEFCIPMHDPLVVPTTRLDGPLPKPQDEISPTQSSNLKRFSSTSKEVDKRGDSALMERMIKKGTIDPKIREKLNQDEKSYGKKLGDTIKKNFKSLWE